jgi:hypothetical protein
MLACFSMVGAHEDYIPMFCPQISSCQHFSEGEIQGLFQDFQGPFSVNSRSWNWEKSLKMANNSNNVCTAGG